MQLSAIQYIGLLMIGGAITLTVLEKIFPTLFHLFFDRVPEVHGGVVISKISGRTRRILKEGLHIKWPWQHIQAISLAKIVTHELSIDSIPTKDGGTVTIKASYQYHPCLSHLPRFMENDLSIVNHGIADMVKSFIGSFAARHTMEELRQTREELEKLVVERLSAKRDFYDRHQKGIVKRTELEDKYGVEIIRLSVTDVDFPPDIQEQMEATQKEGYRKRSEEAGWKNTLERTAQIKASLPGISDTDALNAIQVERGKAHKQIIEIPGLNGAFGAIAGLFSGTPKTTGDSK